MGRPEGGAVVALASVALAFAACSSTPPPVSVHNLERPSDIAFACVGLLAPPSADAGASDDGGAASSVPVVSGRPMYECNKPGFFDPPFDVSRRTFAFIANSARGELSVLDLNNSKLIDLDLANPETNVAPLGVLPEQMSASSDGCRIVTANRGSCDLTMVDIGTLLTPELAAEAKLSVASVASPSGPTTGPSTVAQEIVVRGGNTGKPLRLNPQEIMFLPQDTSAISGGQNLCTRDRPHADPIGWNPTPTQPVETQWKALVTYPTCNLVALVDLPSGNIVDSIKVNPGADGVSIALESTGPDPDCPATDFCDGRTPPAEATPDGGTDSSVDAAASSDGSAPATAAVSSDPFVNPTGVRPSSLAILPGDDRAYVGLTQAAFVAAVDIQPNHLGIPATGGGIKLHEGALGASGIRLSVDPFHDSGVPGQLGAFVGQGDNRQRQYLYVVARDGTVRVVDVSPRTQLLPETECDVNVDPTFVPIASSDPLVPDRTDVCWPTEPPDFAHRRPLARGPGITLPSIPRDVAFADLTTGDHREVVLDGTYAFILTASGAVYETNIAPTLRTQQEVNAVAMPSPLAEVQPLVNSLRDQNMITFTPSLDPSVGPARLDLAPTVPALGPQIQAINTTSPDDNATSLANGTSLPTYVFFPQQICTRAAISAPPNLAKPPTCDSALAMNQPQRQTWNITWEGNFFGPSFTGRVKLVNETTLTLQDEGVDFCQAGALPGDIVTLYGCTVDTQCGPAQVCRRSSTAAETADALPINGLCVPNDSDSTTQGQLLNECAPLLNSLRRYEIVDARSPSGTGLLTLRPEIDEVTSESLVTCATAPRPKPGVDATKCPPPGDDTRSTYTCLAVDDTGPLRCAKACTSDADCRSGRSCVPFGTTDLPTQRICADAPVISVPPKQDAGAMDQDAGAPSKPNLLQICGLDQLSAYQIGAGTSFLVQGTAPAPFVPGLADPTTFSCVPNPERLDRIPYYQTIKGVRTPIPSCVGIDAVKTTNTAADIETALLNDMRITPSPNPCLIGSDPRPSSSMQTAPTLSPTSVSDPTFRVLFQNREIRFMLLAFEKFAGNTDQITFDVHGGFAPDQVVLPTTIDINVPNRIALGPVDSQGQASDMGPTHELPFMFVIDQRRLGSLAAGVGATRGQVLRINPRRATTTDTNSLVPIYDDPIFTNNLWPIQ